jgi:hypothetical protein
MGNEQQEVWDRQPDEPVRWYARFALFRDMGPARTKLGAVNLEKRLEAQKAGKGGKEQTFKPATRTPGAWEEAFRQWNWKKRVEAWDEEQERLAQAACKYARVSERLKLLEKWLDLQSGLMATHVREKGYARADSMEQLRGLLDDIAKETGGRAKVSKKDVTHYLPKEYINMPDDDGVEAL